MQGAYVAKVYVSIEVYLFFFQSDVPLPTVWHWKYKNIRSEKWFRTSEFKLFFFIDSVNKQFENLWIGNSSNATPGYLILYKFLQMEAKIDIFRLSW